MNRYLMASYYDGDKFEAFGETLQNAFEAIVWKASDYTEDEDEAEELRGKSFDVWGWDEDDERHDWTATFV